MTFTFCNHINIQRRNTYFSEIEKIQTKSKEKIININECMSFFSYFLGLAIDTLFDRGGAGVHCYQF